MGKSGLPCVGWEEHMNSDRRSLRAVPAVLRHAVAIALLALVPLGVVPREDVVSGARPAARACQDGACPVASERIVFDDSAYGVAGLPVEVRYPGSVDGTRAVGDGVFPLIVFGHGYRQSYADYAYIWEALVPHGYIIAFPDKLSSSVAIDMDPYARDLLLVAAKMHALAGDAASRYFGRIAEGTAFMGHSTGGGAADCLPCQVVVVRGRVTRVPGEPVGGRVRHRAGEPRSSGCCVDLARDHNCLR